MVLFHVKWIPFNLWDSETWFLHFPPCVVCVKEPVAQTSRSQAGCPPEFPGKPYAGCRWLASTACNLNGLWWSLWKVPGWSLCRRVGKLLWWAFFFFFSISFSYSFKKQTSTNNSEELFMDPFLFSADVIVLGHLWVCVAEWYLPGYAWTASNFALLPLPL